MSKRTILSETLIKEGRILNSKVSAVLTNQGLFYSKGKSREEGEKKKICFSKVIQAVLLSELDGKAGFRLVAFPKATLRSSGFFLKRKRRDYVFFTNDETQAEKWVDSINDILGNAPRHMLAVINPVSGFGPVRKAQQKYIKVSPILELANITLDPIVTEYRFHIKNHIKQMDLSEYDGIICFGGDGIIFEVINGLMEREDWETAIKTPITLIPCGRGIGLPSALNANADIWTVVLHIIKNRTRPIDLLKVTVGNDIPMYAYLVISWCMITHMQQNAERYFMWVPGIFKYAVACFQEWLTFKRFSGRLCYLPADDNDEVKCTSFSDCDKCNQNHLVPYSKEYSMIRHNYERPPTDWKVIEGDFTWFLACNLSRVGRYFTGSPYTHFSDGTFDLVFCRKKISMIQLALIIMGFVDGGKYVHHPAIERIKVKAFTLQPGVPGERKDKYFATDATGRVMIDGEYPNIFPLSAESCRAVATVFCE